MGESTLFVRLTGFEIAFPQCSVAYLPQKTGVQVRIRAEAESDAVLTQRLDDAEAFLIPLMDRFYVGSGETTLEGAVAQLLFNRQETLALAESCTGGLVSHLLTNVPGSSAYFMGGLVTYSNEAKMALLGVSAAVIETHGAVSEETAQAMAMGVRERRGTDWGLAITGIAGPDGGTEEKPVGLVFIACANKQECTVIKRRFYIDRLINKNRFAHAALNYLRLQLQSA
jgi:nicotinamide-nucleotide amidase